MNDRQRFLATIMFEKPDRIPFAPGHGRESTRAAWRTQGLPEGADPLQHVRELLGIEPPAPTPAQLPGIRFTMIPEFEEKIIERRPGKGGAEGTLIVQDWKGNVCEISDKFDPTYLRGAPDFVTRSWVKLPVESRKDWDDMARRYNVDDPGRFSEGWAQQYENIRERDFVCGLTIHGPFWQLREWVGFEGLCMLLLDDPDFASEMIRFWQDFVLKMFDRLFEHFVPDIVTYNEDMAYKEKPMIGPDMSRQFLLPCWRTWTQRARAAGVPIIEIDSDGHVGELIPVWLEAGVNSNSPQEVAAGNDLPAYRQTYGTRMAYRGGVDKRAMAKGGAAIRREFDRIRPAIRAGGYIPGCDHGVPPDVSWPNFVDYCKLLAKETGWI